MILDDMAQPLADETIPNEGAAAGARGLSHNQIMRRLIAPHVREPGAKPDESPRLTAERLATTALGRAAESLYGLAIFPESVSISTVSLSELPELLPERALLAIVEGRRDAIGVVALCPNVVASLIEMQAIGRISSRPVRTRKPTRTDASITADFVGALLKELARDPAPRPDLPEFANFSYASFLDDSRPLMLMLEEGAHTRISLRFRLGAAGQRDGQVMVVLPTPRIPLDQARPDTGQRLLDDARAKTPAPQPPRPDLAEAVQNANLDLVGILCRKTMSLAALKSLRAGSVIALPSNTLDEARVESATGQLLARGRFGETHGFHAIRLRKPARPQAEPPTASSANPALPEIDMTQPDAFRQQQANPHAQTQGHG